MALCDVYKPRVEEGLALHGESQRKGYSDFRKMYEDKDIEAVIVATPDHWHALHDHHGLRGGQGRLRREAA